MMTVAGAWCMTTEEAQMAIGVPVTRSEGPGVLAFNACRIYSAYNYPYLVRMSTTGSFIIPGGQFSRSLSVHQLAQCSMLHQRLLCSQMEMEADA